MCVHKSSSRCNIRPRHQQIKHSTIVMLAMAATAFALDCRFDNKKHFYSLEVMVIYIYILCLCYRLCCLLQILKILPLNRRRHHRVGVFMFREMLHINYYLSRSVCDQSDFNRLQSSFQWNRISFHLFR